MKEWYSCRIHCDSPQNIIGWHTVHSRANTSGVTEVYAGTSSGGGGGGGGSTEDDAADATTAGDDDFSKASMMGEDVSHLALWQQ